MITKHRVPLTDIERENLKATADAIQEANRRARARGLTQAEIDIEGEDEDSQYWDDLRAAGEFRARKYAH